MSDIIAKDLMPKADAPRQGSVEVTTHDDRVVMHFTAPLEYAAFDALTAQWVAGRLLGAALEADDTHAQGVIDMCMAVVDHVYAVRKDIKPVGPALKTELMNRHRKTLTKRLEVMLNSQREKRTVGNHALARTLVETCLKEVFE